MGEAGTEEIVFSGSTLFGHCMTGIVYLLLPVGVCLLLRRYKALQLLPLVFGAGIWFLFTRLDDLFVLAAYSGFPRSAQVVAASLWAGIFEEIGRFLVIYPSEGLISSDASALSYGAGHAGLECLSRAVRSFEVFRTGLRYNAEGLVSFTDGRTEERAAQITEQLSYYAHQTLPGSMLVQINAAAAVLVHVALSLLLFRGIRNGKPKRTLALAIGLHYGLNALSWLASFSESAACTALAGIVCSAGILWLIIKVTDGSAVLRNLRHPDTETIIE